MSVPTLAKPCYQFGHNSHSFLSGFVHVTSIVLVPVPVTCDPVTSMDSMVSLLPPFINFIKPEPTLTVSEKTSFNFCSTCTPEALSVGVGVINAGKSLVLKFQVV